MYLEYCSQKMWRKKGTLLEYCCLLQRKVNKRREETRGCQGKSGEIKRWKGWGEGESTKPPKTQKMPKVSKKQQNQKEPSILRKVSKNRCSEQIMFTEESKVSNSVSTGNKTHHNRVKENTVLFYCWKKYSRYTGFIVDSLSSKCERSLRSMSPNHANW